MKHLLLLILCCFAIISCRNNQTNIPQQDTADSQEMPDFRASIFNVSSKTDLYSAPADTASRLINHKTTEVLGYTDYYSIDTSCTFEVIDSTDNWYKIQVIEPYWLKETHIGWIKKETLESPDKAKLNLKQNVDYHFLKRSKNGDMNNLYFAYHHPFDGATLLPVAKSLKETHCPDEDCNIYIYDTLDLMDIIDKYPLSNEEYLKVADHLIYSYDFYGSGQYYPLQDIKYKELGGKNWKHTPIPNS